MYGKIFTSIYDSTLAEDWRALVTFQQFIVLCDSDGVVDMTPPVISRRTNIPIDIIEAGIKFLEQPDPYSRTPDEDGARIKRLDKHRNWAWKIVNHEKYLKLTSYEKVKEQNRERQKRYREKQKDNNVTNVTVTDGNKKSRHIDKDEDKDINITKPKEKKKTFVLPDYIDSDIWKAFCQHRVKLKAPMTDHAKKLLIGKLSKDELNANEMLNNSIEKGWKGVFPIDGVNNENNQRINKSSKKPSLAERLQKNRETAERQIDEQFMGADGVHIRP